MKHVVHYPVLSAGQVLHTLGRGTASDQLLEVVSTARYSPPGATEGKGTEGHQVLQVPVRTVHGLRCTGTHSQLNPRSVLYPDFCMYFGDDTPELSYGGAMPPIWSRSQAPQSLPKDRKT